MRDNLQAEAVLAAEYVLAEIDHVPGTRVDVYAIIARRGVWLSFDPYDDVLGIYQRLDDCAGVSINCRRPTNMQRFTAAHELGHHELGHEFSYDDEAAIEGRVRDPRESQAQTFAASLLMSEVSVEAGLEILGLDPDRPRLSPMAVYRLGATLGVSYKAMLMQLAVLGKLRWSDLQEYGKSSPIKQRRQLVAPFDLPDSRRQVHSFNLEHNSSTVYIGAEDVLVVELPDPFYGRSTWRLTEASQDGFVVIDHALVAAADVLPIFEDSSKHLFMVEPARHGRHRIAFSLCRSDLHAEDIAEFSLEIVVEPTPMSSLGQGIFSRQQNQLLEI